MHYGIQPDDEKEMEEIQIQKRALSNEFDR